MVSASQHYITYKSRTTNNPIEKMTSQIPANDDNHFLVTLRNIMHYSKDKMIESRESFDKVIEFIISYKDDMTAHDLQELIFFMSCTFYPKVAIFMMENNMCPKEIHFTLFQSQIPLQMAIKSGHVELVEYFIENLEYFDDLLVISDFGSIPALYSITNSVSGVKILEHILKSKHCTEQTIESIFDHRYKRNVVAHYSYVHDKLLKTLLDSEKCTAKAILVCPSDVFRNPLTLKLVLESGKLPDNFFENYLEIFEYPTESVKVFMDSQYCNEQLVERHFGTGLEGYTLTNKHSHVSRILAHPKYSHLAKKYDLDGTIKPEY